MRIGVTYNLKSDIPSAPHPALPEDLSEEFDYPETIDAIREVLSQDGHEVHLLGAGLSLIEKIKRFQIEFVFNLAEGFHGRNREAQLPAIFELMGLPYSGSDPLGLAVTLDKSLAKRIAISLGIRTPEFWVLDEPENLDQIPSQFPLFVKPLWQGSSIGIRASSRADDRAQLEREVKRLFEHYGDNPVLVEEYVPGREFTVGMVGNKKPEILGIMEMTFRGSKQKDFCYSLEVKRHWKEEVDYHVPPDLKQEADHQIRDAALRLFTALRLRDFSRFDFRMNGGGQIYFLEANPLAGLSPESGDLVILARKKGLSFRELILKIAQAAFDRYPELCQSKAKGQTHS